jgi:hypothetical protein
VSDDIPLAPFAYEGLDPVLEPFAAPVSLANHLLHVEISGGCQCWLASLKLQPCEKTVLYPKDRYQTEVESWRNAVGKYRIHDETA